MLELDWMLAGGGISTPDCLFQKQCELSYQRSDRFEPGEFSNGFACCCFAS